MTNFILYECVLDIKLSILSSFLLTNNTILLFFFFFFINDFKKILKERFALVFPTGTPITAGNEAMKVPPPVVGETNKVLSK